MQSLRMRASTRNSTAAVPPPPRLPPKTLTALLQDDIVTIETLYSRHGAVATIAKSLLGIVPNTGKYFEIWPPANRMYYFMVPTFLNLPAFMFGYGAPKNLVSLAMYTSSLAANCPYCTSHTCTFAVRRGVPIEKLLPDVVGLRNGEKRDAYTDVERSVIDVAEGVSRFPCKLTNAQRRALVDEVNNAGTAEAIVLGAAMMGYLNKSMDALGMPLEIKTYRETRGVMGEKWSLGQSGQLLNPEVHTAEAPPSTDSYTTYWSMIMQGPSAAKFEGRVLAGIPSTAEEATAFLVKHYGHDFPVLKQMVHVRPMRAVAGMCHECFSLKESVIGIKAKVLIGQVFATITQSKPVQEAIADIAKHFEIDSESMVKATELAQEEEPIAAAQRIFPGQEDRRLQALLVVGHVSSFSPARTNEHVITLCRDANLEGPALVEVVAIVSVLQMLHRISMFYRFDDEV